MKKNIFLLLYTLHLPRIDTLCLTGLILYTVFTGCAALKLGTGAGEYSPDYLPLANFDSMLEVNDYDGSLLGCWNGFPDDISQKCEFNFFEPGHNGTGYCLQIIYNVDSPREAYNGFWMLFKDLNFRSYNKFTFWARTASEKSSPGRFKVELKGSFKSELKNEEKKVMQKFFNAPDTKWQKFEINLTENVFIEEWKSINEFTIVFAKDEVDSKRGVLFIDDFGLEK